MADPKPPQTVVTTATGPHGTIAVVTTQEKVKVWMQIIVSLVVLFTGLLILTSPNFAFHQNFDEGTKKWAAGWVGAVVGYWLA